MISSQDNALFKLLISLTTSRGIKKHNQCLVSGIKLIDEFVKNKNVEILNLIDHDPDRINNISLPRASKAKPLVMSKELFKQLDIYGTNNTLIVCKPLIIEDWDLNQEPRGVELIVACQDPGNLGALMRTAAAFGVKNIVLLKEASNAFHPKVTRAASGANFNFNIYSGPSIKDYKANHTYALDLEGQNIHEFKFPKNLRLLVGEEGPGVPKDIEALRLNIPTDSATESLNAMVAASIALYEITK